MQLLIYDCLLCSNLPFTDVGPPAHLDGRTPVLVDTFQSLKALTENLQQQKCFALDLEHHAEHSYLGWTCLLQINAGKMSLLKPRHALTQLPVNMGLSLADVQPGRAG